MEQENPKEFFEFKILVSEQGSTDSHILEQDTCHWQSICYQGTKKINMSLRDVYSKPGSLTVIENIIKVLSCRICKSLGPFNMFTVKGCSETVFYREWSNQILTVCTFQNKVAMTIIFFFKIFKI